MGLADINDISVEEVKNYLRLNSDFDDDDDLLENLVLSAIGEVESYTGSDFDEYDEMPADVRVWILKKVAKDYFVREAGKSSESVSGISEGFSMDVDEKEKERYLFKYKKFWGF